ncbi:MAG: NAD+ synthase [Cyanobacteriota bacterium]
MRIAIAQINPVVGDITTNKNKIIEYINKAIKLNADLVVFSETAIVGYPAKDLLERSELIDRNLSALNDLRLHSDSIGILCGFIDRNPLKTGKSLHNSAALIHDGNITFKQAKSLLPEYDVFDENRYFEPARCVHVTEFRGLKLGITICEDIWINSPEVSFNYKQDPNQILTQLGADILINLSASPYSFEKPHQRLETIKNCAIKNNRCVIYANQVGGNDELIFDGNSIVVNQHGEIVALANNFEEDLIIYDTISGTGDIHNPSTGETECIYKALKLGLRDYVKKCGFTKVILGLSGGIDSALTAALAAKALGPENVVGISLPGPYSSQGSLDDARDLANNLGIEYQVYPIDKMFEASLLTIQPDKESPIMDLAEENLQARLRANIIMALSNRYGYFPLTTGNKSESAVGYATLYGDMCGGLAVISDLYKNQVYNLANFINKVEGVLIPQNSIHKAPSAELKPNQLDQDSLPDYNILDKILKDYIEEGLSFYQLNQKYDKDTVKFVLKKVDQSEFKRRQAAVGLKISTKAFGSGRRLPIAQRYKWE